jgi:hypothetical protein
MATKKPPQDKALGRPTGGNPKTRRKLVKK